MADTDHPCAVPLVPLERIPHPLFSHSESSSLKPPMDQGSVRHCWTVPGLEDWRVRRDGGSSPPPSTIFAIATPHDGVQHAAYSQGNAQQDRPWSRNF